MKHLGVFALILGLVFFHVPSAQAGTLWRTDLESADLAGRVAYNTGGAVASSSYGAHGTIVTVGTNTSSKGILLSVDSSAAAGSWTAGVTTGVVTLTTANSTITNPGLVTLSFSLRASKANPVVLRVESYNAGNVRTGGLKTLIYSATANYYQRFAIDLSTMAADGAGTFNPLDPKIAVSLELDSTAGGDGWPKAAGLTLKVDNLHYATPRYYVKPAASGGVDSSTVGAGVTEATAYATPNFAVGKAVAGDIIVVKAGTYSGAVSFGAKAGVPDGWISLKNYPGEAPLLRYGTNVWNAVFIGAGSKGSIYTGPAPAYLEVRGMTVRGNSGIDANGDRFLDTAIVPDLVTKLGAYPETNTNGISIEGRYMTQLPHDFRFANNVVENNPGGGIVWLRADRVLVEENEVRNNCWWMIYGGSGISTLVAADFEINADYRTVIQRNRCHGNETMVPWYSSTARFSDGNGIIIDTNRNSEVTTSTLDAPYAGGTLVQSNLAFNNGGSGIHAYHSQNTDIVHNTAYLNSASSRLQSAQIFANASKNVRMLANILVAPMNNTGISALNESVTGNSNNIAGTIYFQNNRYSGGNTALPSDANFTGNVSGTPGFFSPSIVLASADFHLRASSTARNAANVLTFGSALDFAGRPRLSSGISDQGAYHTQGNDAYAPNFSPLPGNYSSTQSVTLASDTTATKIVYTTNGSMPTVDGAGNITNGTEYTGAISVSAAITVQAITWKSGLATSVVTSGAYTFTDVSTTPIPDLIFYPPGGTYTGAQSVAIVCRTPGAFVRYTLDGSTPTSTTGTLAPADNIAITTNRTLKAIAYLPGRANSAVKSASYTVIQPYAAPTFSPPAGTYYAAQTVSITAEAGASIRYTVDDTTPSSTVGTVYGGPVTISGDTTLQAIAYSATTPSSPVASGTYVIDPVVTASPATVTRVLPAATTVASTIAITNPSTASHTYTISVRGTGAATSYSVKKTGDAGGPSFSWQDISTSGALISALENSDDTNAGPFSLGFSFPFYGTNFTTTLVCSNGWLSFTDTGSDYANLSLPTASAPKNLIALYWEDFVLRPSPVPAAHSYYRSGSTSFIAQYNDVKHFSDDTVSLTAQAILKSGGEIVFQYLTNTVSPTTNFTIGVQNSTGAIGQNVATGTTSYVTNNLAVRLTPQGPAASGLSLASPVTVTIPAGGTANVTVQFSSGSLSPGSYAANLQISSDSVMHPLTLVPVSLAVATTLTWAQWQALWFDAAQLANPLISGPLADPDGDGAVNLLEWALGSGPTNGDSAAKLSPGTDGLGNLTITFPRIADPSLLYEVLGSSDLTSWLPIWSSTGAANTAGPIIVSDSPPANSTRRFLKLRVSVP